MPVIDSVNRKGVTGALGKRVTKGPYWLVGPKSGDIKSDFSRLSGIRGKVDQYEITNGAGTEAGSYTITIRPFAERGFPALHRAVGDVAIFRQINGVADPDADVSCLVRKRPYSGSVPLTVGPVDVLAGDRLWVVVENKDASTLKYKIDVTFDLDNQASLDLRFAETKSLVDATTGNNLVTFARGGSGTYVGSDGLIKTAATNEPRFTHDPVTGESLGLLVEEQRVNLLQRTEEFDNAAWAKSAGVTVTPNAIQSPAGTLTAARVQFTSADQTVQQDITGVSGISYAGSVWVKGTAGETLRLGGANISGATNIALTGGWDRLVFAGTSSSTSISLVFSTFGGATARDIYIWGAQLEAGAFPTSYIKNVDNPLGATRAADVASIEGVNFSSWYQQSGGSLFTHSARQRSVPTGEFPVAASLNDGTSDNRINNSFITAPLAGLLITSGGATVASIYPAVTALDRKFATAFATDDFAASVNGGAVLTDTSGTLPVVNQLRIGDMTGGNALNGTIRRLVYWSQRLPSQTLQALTR